MKLNLTLEPEQIEGWTSMSARTMSPLPNAEAVRMVNVLHRCDCLSTDTPNEMRPVLGAVAESLPVGGKLYIGVPDFRYIAGAFVDGRGDIDYQSVLLGADMVPDGRTRTIWTELKLRRELRQAGFGRISLWPAGTESRPDSPAGVYLVAEKMQPGLKLPKAYAILSAGRLGFQDFFDSVIFGLQAAQVPYMRVTGATWGEVMEKGLVERLLPEHPDLEVIITLDWDSIFRPEQVLELLRLMAEYPEADAIVPVQCHRGDGKWMLGWKPDVEITRESFDQDLVRIRSGHFGLTAIRTSKLKTLPHPWFFAQPGPDGHWGDGSVPVDLHFWNQWEKAGNSCYLAPRIKLGHAVEVISWPAEEPGNAVYQTFGDYQRGNVPAHVRI